MKRFELVKRQDRWDLYGEDGSKIASSAPNPFKRLSIKNCEAIEMGYDLDELANKFTEHFNTFDVVKSDIQVGYKKGFNKAMELNDKLFTVEDLYRVYLINAAGNNTTLRHFFEETVLPMFEQPTEIEVEVEMTEDYLTWKKSDIEKLSDCLVPKLDENGCLILKKL